MALSFNSDLERLVNIYGEERRTLIELTYISCQIKSISNGYIQKYRDIFALRETGMFCEEKFSKSDNDARNREGGKS